VDAPTTKAVIPAAGLGTRFLPATKVVPKELLPSSTYRRSNTSLLKRRGGLRDIVMVTGRGKSLLEDHFDRVPEIEAALEKKGDHERLARGPPVEQPREPCTTCAGRTAWTWARGLVRRGARRQPALRRNCSVTT